MPERPIGDMRVTLLLSVQEALLGAVPPALRAVTCGWAGEEITLRFIFDGEISEQDHESVEVASTEAIADFTEPWTIAVDIIRADYPVDVRPHGLSDWAYMRDEQR